MLFYLETWQAWLIACAFGAVATWAGYASCKAFQCVDKISRQRVHIKKLRDESIELKRQIKAIKAVEKLSYPELTKEEFEILLLLKGKTKMEQDQILGELEEQYEQVC